MKSNDGKSNLDKTASKIRTIWYDEPRIEELKSKFDLSDIAISAAILIHRLFFGIGTGLRSSKRDSFAAISVWYGSRIVDGREISKEDLARAVGVHPRTLTRRFKELENDERCVSMLEYVKDRIEEWDKKREERLQDLL